MILEVGFIALFVLFVVFLISALPLNMAVKFMGGKTNLLKTAIVSLIAGLVVTAVRGFFDVLGGIFAFLILIWIYHLVFNLGWLRALAAWFLQFIFLVVLYLVLIMFFGVVIGISLI